MMKNLRFVFIFLLCFSSYVSGQIVNRVFLRNHQQYMVDVIKEVLLTVEDRGWHSLTLPDIVSNINETVFSRNYNGTLTYKNGFLVGMQHIDVLQSSLNQVWQFVDWQVRVDIRGQLRMTDVSLGYDIQADFADGTHHYTALVTIPLVFFDFSILYFPMTHQKTVEVTGNQNLLNINVNMLPSDTTSDALTTMHRSDSTLAGIQAWSQNFQELAKDIVDTDRVPFPDYCYNCAL